MGWSSIASRDYVRAAPLIVIFFPARPHDPKLSIEVLADSVSVDPCRATFWKESLLPQHGILRRTKRLVQVGQASLF